MLNSQSNIRTYLISHGFNKDSVNLTWC